MLTEEISLLPPNLLLFLVLYGQSNLDDFLAKVFVTSLLTLLNHDFKLVKVLRLVGKIIDHDPRGRQLEIPLRDGRHEPILRFFQLTKDRLHIYLGAEI